MKRVLTVCGLVCLGAVIARADDKDKLDPNKLVGDWTYVSGKRAGEDVAKERMAGQVTFTKDKIEIPAGDQKFIMAYKVDPKTSPASIDIEIKEGPVNEGKAQGIIAVKDDEMQLCYVPEGAGNRPNKFESTKDNGAFYFVLKRVKKDK